MTAQSASSVALDELNLVVHRKLKPEALTLARQCLPDLEPLIHQALAGDEAALKELRETVRRAHTKATQPRGFGRRDPTKAAEKAAADAKSAATK